MSFPPALLCALLLSASLATAHPVYKPSTIRPPPPTREFRAAWIATVNNIDWPSRRELTVQEQKAELLRLLDRAQKLKLNAVIFQVRPGCDAMYPSKIEPWSEFLTGTMGKAPEPLYDPLAFAINEAHKRGLELHAWFNPYRARMAGDKSPASANHITATRPQLVRHYGKQVWLDPGEKEVQGYSLSVVMDVVSRYDVDGVHFDDYFYPYREKDGAGDDLPFPDDSSWQRFGAGAKLSRDDWRRQNVNAFIERTYRAIKASKPWVKFGISPFGIWRDGVPPQIKGFDAYSKLYADSRKWLANGWLDYFAPQLYWAIDSRDQSFPVLLKWWGEQNTRRRLLAPGLDSTKAGRRWQPAEIVNQIRLTRCQPGVSGHIHWNMTSLIRSEALDDALLKEVYSTAALVPASAWLGSDRLKKPRLSVSQKNPAAGVTFNWGLDQGVARLWLIQTQAGGKWRSQVLPASQTSLLCDGQPVEVAAVCAVDRFGNTGPATVLQAQTGHLHPRVSAKEKP